MIQVSYMFLSFIHDFWLRIGEPAYPKQDTAIYDYLKKNRYGKQELPGADLRIRQKALFAALLRSLFETAVAYLALQPPIRTYEEMAQFFHSIFNSKVKDEFCNTVVSKGS